MFSVPFLDHLFSIGWIRKALWKLWYPWLTRRLHREEVLFLNYAYEEEPPMGIPLSPGDEIRWSKTATEDIYREGRPMPTMFVPTQVSIS